MKLTSGYLTAVFAFNLIHEKVEGLTSCPDGYIKHGSSCYRFHHQHLSWPESITYCKTLGSELVRIEDANEHQFLIAKAQEIYGDNLSAEYLLHPRKPRRTAYQSAIVATIQLPLSRSGSFSIHNFWIDLTDALVQGEWSWTRDSYTKATYLHWGPDQPEYAKAREDCAGLVSYEGFLFGDWTCDTLMNPICEITLVPTGNEIIG